MLDTAARIALTPLLIGGASLAGRRWGHHVGGWLVALPLTSGPVAFLLATDHGPGFAAQASLGMMAGTTSQVMFALAYRRFALHGWPTAVTAGGAAFCLATLVLASLRWPALPTFTLVLAGLAGGYAAVRKLQPRAGSARVDSRPVASPPPMDIPVRMVSATVVVLAITSLAPVIGPWRAGLLSPFPVLGAVLAVFTHRTHGPAAGTATLDGLLLGLAAPAVFFLALGLTLPSLGLASFAVATAAGLLSSAVTMHALPRRPDTATSGTATTAQ